MVHGLFQREKLPAIVCWQGCRKYAFLYSSSYCLPLKPFHSIIYNQLPFTGWNLSKPKSLIWRSVGSVLNHWRNQDYFMNEAQEDTRNPVWENLLKRSFTLPQQLHLPGIPAKGDCLTGPWLVCPPRPRKVLVHLLCNAPLSLPPS